jgi:hypothetical protein
VNGFRNCGVRATLTGKVARPRVRHGYEAVPRRVVSSGDKNSGIAASS